MTLSNDELSAISGWMSIACWIVVYSPQIWENYQLKSGEGLSVSFIVLWLLGDLTSLGGGVLANLLPTMNILAGYYALCDIVLLAQVYWYRRLRANASSFSQIAPAHAHTETDPLLPNSPESTTRSLPLPDPPKQPKPLLPPYLEYPLLLLFVFASGLFAWFLTETPDDIGIPEKPGKGGEVELEWRSQTLGWISAFLYLGSRVPQIVHNLKTRCAGLSLAMFFFSISGNLTYAMSILLISLETRYLIANASWLAGSLLTIGLDLFVISQFVVYNWQDRRAEERKVFAEEEGEIQDS